MIIIVMGVSGCGKSTIGQMLADHFGCQFLDADKFHSEENVEKMRRGQALTDVERQPWLEGLNRMLSEASLGGNISVLACSALKQAYRDTISKGLNDVRVVYLKGSEELIAARLAVRRHHYMNPNLLGSQFATLEEPQDAVVVDIAKEPSEIVEDILARLS